MASRRTFAGIPVHNTVADVFTRFLNRRRESARQTAIFFANANFIDRCQALRDRLAGDPDLYIVNDGIGLNVASVLLYRSPFRENLNGTDFVPAYLRQAPMGTTLYLVGGTPAAVNGAARHFDFFKNINVVGLCDGYSIWQNETAVVADISEKHPDIVLVAFGNPLQEEWILRWKAELPPCLIFGVGALFDFVSGEKRRAPLAVRMLRMEWAHRLALDPCRLVGRYTVGILRFLALVIGQRRQA